MEDFARRRRTRTLGPVLALSLASAGCVAGAARFEAGPSFGTTTPPAPEDQERPGFSGAACLPAGLEPYAAGGLAAAKKTTAGPKKGLGLSAGWQSTVFSKWQTKATDAIPTGPGAASDGQYMYSDLFGDGWGSSFSLVMGRPPTGMPSAGDTYLLGRFDFQRFPGRIWQGGLAETATFDPIHQYRFSAEAKTILKPIGRKLRPYARYSVGLVQIGSVTAETQTSTERFWDSTVTWGVSGGFGIDIHIGLWLFADIGIDVIGPPKRASSTAGVGEAEAMVATPMRFGVLLKF